MGPVKPHFKPRALPAKARPVRQERSRRTLDRLLAAAEAVLSRDGLDRATVPRIAGEAGLSVGSVYRRFPDKDALLRAVYARFLGRAEEGQVALLRADVWRGLSPESIARILVHHMTRQYLGRRGLYRALIRYAETHADPAFRRQADSLNATSFELVTAALLPHARRIRHPDPRRGIEFGILAVAAALRLMVLGEDRGLERWIPRPDHLGEQLTRMFLGYLGLPQSEVRAPWVAFPAGASPALRERLVRIREGRKPAQAGPARKPRRAPLR